MGKSTLCLLLICVCVGLAHSSTLNRQKRFAISRVWPGGVIPYWFQDNFDDGGRENFLKAIEKISSRTCLTFPKRQPSDSYSVQIAHGDGCGGTYTGRYTDKENAHILFVSKDCSSNQAVFEHELGHVIGFPHEQARMDRDQYVTWNTSLPTCKGNPPEAELFKEEDQAALDIFYDYVSLMHDWKECITPKLPGPITIGSSADGKNNTFSVLDYEKINAVYGCGGCNSYRFRNIKQLAYSDYPLVAGNDSSEGNLVYICRVYHEGSILIGKGKPDQQKCYIVDVDGEIEYEYYTNFEVLTDPKQTGNFEWIKRPDDFSIPKNAVVGGRTVDRIPVYIGRCKAGGDSLFPGSLLEGQKQLRVGWNSKDAKCPDYEILVCKENQ